MTSGGQNRRHAAVCSKAPGQPPLPAPIVAFVLWPLATFVLWPLATWVLENRKWVLS